MLAIIFVFYLFYDTTLHSWTLLSVFVRGKPPSPPPTAYTAIYIHMYMYTSSFSICTIMYDCCAHIIAVQCWTDWHLYVHVYVYYVCVYELSRLTFPAKQLTPNCHCGRHNKTQILPIILYHYLCVFVFVFVLILIWLLYLQPIVNWWRKPNTPWILPNLPN